MHYNSVANQLITFYAFYSKCGQRERVCVSVRNGEREREREIEKHTQKNLWIKPCPVGTIFLTRSLRWEKEKQEFIQCLKTRHG